MSLICRLHMMLLLAAGFCLVASAESSAGPSILIDKPNSVLYVIGEPGDTLARYPVALGRNLGQKLRHGDNKTPEGEFSIVSIEDSSGWEGDASGSDYGPWFLRLGGGVWTHIGIHGTNRPETIGTRASLGCIRMENSDLEKLYSVVRKGTRVVILPDTAQTFVPSPKGYGKAYKAKGAYRYGKHRGKTYKAKASAYSKAKANKPMKNKKGSASARRKPKKRR